MTSPNDSSAREPDFTPQELRDVLGAFNLGAVHSVKPLRAAGSPSPKALVVSDRGTLLLKRRRHGRDDLRRVAFTHDVQLRLIERGFPTPRLVRTRDDHTMLTRDGRVYELFEFIEGERFDRSPEQALEAGRVLGDFHRLLRPRGQAEPTRRRPIPAAQVRDAVARLAPPEPASVIRRHYDEAVAALERLGQSPVTRLLVHGDWHPGNLRYRAGHVEAVIDYDAVGLGVRVTDLAYGAIQFSLAGGPGPGGSGLPPSEARLRAFAQGYHASMDLPIDEVEGAAAPWLMIRALVSEATEGRSAASGAGLWSTIRTACDWIHEEREVIRELFIS